MKHFRVFMVVLLVVSLVININLLFRLGNLEDQVNDLSYTQQDVISSVHGQTSHIESVLSDIKDEQSWISTVSLDGINEAKKDGRAELTFEWQVKELHTDSEVVFNYSYGDKKNYITLPAEEIQQGLFQARIPFEISLEPLWEISINKSDSNGEQETSVQEVEERSKEEQNQNSIKYFVTVSYEDMVRSGEIHTENLEYLGTSQYGIIQGDLHMYDNNIDVSLITHNVSDSSNAIKEAYLLKYKDKTFIGKEELKMDDHYDQAEDETHFFYLNQVENIDDMRLVIQVVYSNGETFEKEVY